MTRMLPERWPIFWHEVRRRLLQRRQALAQAAGITFLISLLLVIISVATRQPSIAAGFWRIWLHIQAIVLIMLVPAFTAGVITTERERGTLPLLFLTPLPTVSLLGQRLAAYAVVALVFLGFAMPLSLALALAGHLSPALVSGQLVLLVSRALAYLAFGFMISCLARTTRTATVMNYGLLFMLEFCARQAPNAYDLTPLRAMAPAALLPWITGPGMAFTGAVLYLLAGGLCFAIAVSAFAHERRSLGEALPRRESPAPVLAHLRWYLPDRYPIIWDELRRRLRGSRIFDVILGFVLILCVVVVAILLLVEIDPDLRAYPRYGNMLFVYAMLGQLVMMAIIAPGLTATIFSSERERSRLEFLMLTHLSVRQLVIGKFLGAMVVLLLMALCGAPIIAIIAATFGGISPVELFAGYFAILLAGLFCASTAMLYACKAKDSTKALTHGYAASTLGILVCAALIPFCGIGLVLTAIQIIRNINHTVTHLEELQREPAIDVKDPYGNSWDRGHPGRTN